MEGGQCRLFVTAPMETSEPSQPEGYGTSEDLRFGDKVCDIIIWRVSVLRLWEADQSAR